MSPLGVVVLIVLVDLLGFSIVMPLLAPFAQEYGFSGAQIGVLFAAYPLCQLVAGPILGRLSIPSRAEFSARFMPMMVVIMPTVVLMTLASGFQLALGLGNLESLNPNHSWLVASFAVVGVMATVALGVLEPANIAVLFEMKKPHPNGELIARLMRRFIYAAGITGAMQIATLVIMTRVATQ